MRRPLTVLALIGLVAFTGCSSDEPDDTADSVETDVAAPTTVATTVPEEAAPATDAPTTTEGPVEPVAPPTVGSAIQIANGISFDQQDQLWVASVRAGIFVVDPDSGEVLQRYPANVASADDLAVAPDGTVYFTDLLQGQVGIIDPDGTLREERLEVAPGANSITFSDDGRLFVGSVFGGDGLFEVDTTGATPPRVVAPDPGQLNGMDFGPDGFIYAPRWTEGTIVRVDPETGEFTTIAEGSESQYSAVKFDADGVLHTVESNPAHVVEIDITTGERTILATLEGTNDNLAFDSTGRLFVSTATASATSDGAVHEILDDGSVRSLK